MKTIASLSVTALFLAACVSMPPPPTAERSFATHCSSCHGPLGEGDGPMVEVMRVNVPNLRQLSQRNDGVFPADAVAGYIDGRNLPVSHGDRAMPVWGDVFDTTTRILRDAEAAEDRIADIVELLRDIQYE
jgi:mono/diheme cytochrome c family protein